MSGKTCQICGKPSGIYPLCKTHLTMKANGEVVKCENCETWFELKKGCPNCKKEIKTAKATVEENTTSDLTCIICGEPSNGKHFCYNCYKQFSNKILYIKVSKCKDFEKLESEYESDFVCEDGHLVKSPYEKIIDNWLYQEGIHHAYEKKIDIDKDKDLTPDFYIPEYNGKKDIYVEFWGYDESNKKYQQRKEYKTKIYPELVKRDNITVVYLNRKEVENDSYKKKIKYADAGKINE